MKGYRFLEHTADIMIEAWGSTLEEAFEAAGIAFYDVIINVNKINKKITYKLEASGFDLMSLLYDWIEKLILIFELENLVFGDFKIVIDKNEETYRIRGTGYGEKYVKELHGYKVHVKAMTYHEMSIEEKDDLIYLKYVVDI